MENSTKLQRGGKTSGLTGLDNCLNNSDIDFPLLSSQFKDLNLQLHASTTVTNPYTFNIRGNTSFSSSIEADIPDKTTLLGNNSSSNTDDTSTLVSVTIPKGVNVILVHGIGEYFVHLSGEQDSLDLDIGRADASGHIVKLYSQGYGVSNSYVKVTPGKRYDIILYGTQTNYDNVVYNLSLSIYYSKTINNTTPTVTDL